MLIHSFLMKFLQWWVNEYITVSTMMSLKYCHRNVIVNWIMSHVLFHTICHWNPDIVWALSFELCKHSGSNMHSDVNVMMSLLSFHCHCPDMPLFNHRYHCPFSDVTYMSNDQAQRSHPSQCLSQCFFLILPIHLLPNLFILFTFPPGVSLSVCL